jgi:beta-catenin-like protein 1
MRMNESKRDEFTTIHKTLGIIENLVEVMPILAKTICDRTKILTWLIKKISKDKNPEKAFDDNKLYASEVLTILLQNSKENQFTLVKMGGIDHILTTMAVKKK